MDKQSGLVPPGWVAWALTGESCAFSGEEQRAQNSNTTGQFPGPFTGDSALFNGEPEFEVVGSLRGLRGLTRHARRLLPELIVADVKPVKTGVRPIVIAIKQSSPASKLILICSLSDLIDYARRCGADACLDQEKLVRSLVPTASALSLRATSPHSRQTQIPRSLTRHRPEFPQNRKEYSA